MMERLRDILVTDRALPDVKARNEKGTYNDVDLNRVLRACSWLAGRLEGYGYSVPGEYFPAALISVTVDPPLGGTAKGAAAYRGETVRLEAIPAAGFEFDRWLENGEAVSGNMEYSFTADRDRRLTAVFTTRGGLDYGVVGIGRVGMARVRKRGD